MKTRSWISIPLAALCLGGAYVSSLLLDRHWLKSPGPAWFAAACGDQPETEGSTTQPDVESPEPETLERTPETRGHGSAARTHATPGGRDCGAVLASRWSTLPPRGEPSEDALDAAAKPQFRVPVAFIGLAYFTSLAIWFAFIGRVSPDKPQWYRLPLLAICGGLLFSIFYLILMFVGMDEWCPWCLATHGINFVVLVGMLFLRPAKESYLLRPLGPRDRGEGETGREGEGETRRQGDKETGRQSGCLSYDSHPSGRLVTACLLLCLAVGAMLWNGYGVLAVQAQKKAVEAHLAKFAGDATFLTTLYFSKPEVKIAIRDDDPQSSRDPDFCPLVVFSDFQCPWCRSFALLVEKRLQNRFQNHLRVVWKHYPLCTECNPHVKHNRHTESCRAARAAEAARIQGGNAAFWKAHNRLFESQQTLESLDYAKLARDLGLDPERFLRDMDSEPVTRRIAEDADQAKALGVTATPAIFLLNRPVDGTLARIGIFWDHMAISFNTAYDEKTYPQKLKKLEHEGKLPPTTQHSHSDHE